jgi:thiol-disulfide isomerase/thioredoxin
MGRRLQAFAPGTIISNRLHVTGNQYWVKNSVEITNPPHLDSWLSAASNHQEAVLDDDDEVETSPPTGLDRRRALGLFGLAAMATATTTLNPQSAHAAPPISIIAEELGYFPVQNKAGQTVYVSKRVQRESSDQAVRLVAALRKADAVMYGAFWCPHCARQKELFGRQAWSQVPYVECASQGYGANPKLCTAANVDGYPTWVLKKSGKEVVVSGERSLAELAELVGFRGFRLADETNLPPSLGSAACK